jgi:hypothetical protein
MKNPESLLTPQSDAITGKMTGAEALQAAKTLVLTEQDKARS